MSPGASHLLPPPPAPASPPVALSPGAQPPCQQPQVALGSGEGTGGKHTTKHNKTNPLPPLAHTPGSLSVSTACCNCCGLRNVMEQIVTQALSRGGSWMGLVAAPGGGPSAPGRNLAGGHCCRSHSLLPGRPGSLKVLGTRGLYRPRRGLVLSWVPPCPSPVAV